jgi:hypothetical protein
MAEESRIDLLNDDYFFGEEMSVNNDVIIFLQLRGCNRNARNPFY